MKTYRVIAIVIAVLLWCAFMINQRYLFFSLFNTFVQPKSIEIKELSLKEKLEDFSSCYDTMFNGNPTILDYKGLYGFNIVDKKSTYERMIKNTSNNYEFYCVMDAFIQDIPSFHTDLVYPSVENYNSSNCFGQKIVMSSRSVIGASSYWKHLLKCESDKYDKKNFLVFEYIDGEYICVDNSKEYVLSSIDGSSVDDFVLDNPTVHSLYYDHENKKAVRREIIFNEKKGKKRKVVVKDANGNEKNMNLCWDIYEEEAYLNSFDSDEAEEDYYSKNIGDVKYIKIDTLDEETGKLISKELKKCKNNKIILDLRDNWGGDPEICSKYIYPYLGIKNIEYENKWYMPLYRNTEIEFENIFNKIIYNLKSSNEHKLNSNSEVALSTTKIEYEGDSRNINKKVVILTSHNTGSAADGMTNILGRNSNVTVVGENTGGEGLMGTFAMDYLGNSKLVYVYMPSIEAKAEVTLNSVYGTEPDIYCQIRKEDYMKKIRCKSGSFEDVLIEKAINVLNGNFVNHSK